MKTVLVTGSSRGIGLAIASGFALNGFNTVLNCAHNPEALFDAVSRLKKTNPNVAGTVADISEYSNAARMFDEAQERFGGVDILINNAGISYVGLFNESSPEDYARVINTNLMSVMHCSHLAVKRMITAHSGCIINISSVWGGAGASCEAAYSASKGGVNTFTRALARELGPCGVRVNAVACGVIDTGMNDFLSENEKTALTENIPLMRFGTVDEVAKLVFYLASDQAEYITGQVITIDGGFA